MSLLLDLLFPKTCYGCGKNEGYLCSKCLSKIKTQSIRIDSKNKMEGSISVFKYDFVIKKTTHGLKYDFVSDLSDELSNVVVKRIKSDFKNLLRYWQSKKFVLVPIPLHQFRSNWRGFNQSVLIGQKIAAKLKLKFLDSILIRSKNNISQTRIKDKLFRKPNVADIFSVNDIRKNPQNIILFDDILTTGSTIDSAITCLENKFKIKKVWALTIAG